MSTCSFRSVVRVCSTVFFLGIGALLLPSALSAQIHPNHAQGFEPQHAYQIGNIENVNLFNGNLTLTIPIGSRYPVGGELSYGLTLSYTGNVWEWEEDYLLGPSGYQYYLKAIPRKRSNAGLGWQLTLGQLNPPRSLLTNAGVSTYESSDGAIHAFGPSLHKDGSQTSGYTYTTDGTYLRLNTVTRTIEFPDGMTQTFDSSGRLIAMQDRHNNGLTVSYLTSPVRWVINDTQGRTQTVYFKDASYYGAGSVVDKVVLEAFNGQTATYTFNYSEPYVVRGFTNVYAINQGLIPRTIKLPLLTSIIQPDGSSYSMPVSSYDLGPASPETSILSGSLLGMRLPTGGTMEWDWTEYLFPQASARRVPLRNGTSELDPANPFRKSAGLVRRRHKSSAGSLLGEWTYDQVLDSEPDYRTKQSRTTVTDPRHHPTTYYFSVFDDDMDPATPEPTGYYPEEYGLPFSRKTSDGTSPARYISAKIRNSSGSLLRTIYVRYDRDGGTAANPRLASKRTVFHDDGGTHLDVTSSGFDGVGHYRTVVTSGNLAGSDRTTFTNYNPGWCATCQPSTGTSWILDTYTDQTVTEGTASAETEYCWSQGLLTRKRVLAYGTTRGSTDLVDWLVRDGDGNVTAEKLYGGDLQSVGTGTLCNLSLGTPAYEVDNTYQYGSVKTSKFSGTTFYALDQDLDFNTGLPSASRDSSGLSTSFTYDKMGRLTLADAAPTAEADTYYTYGNYSGSSPARVTIEEKSGTTVLTQQQIQFDGFGNVALERRLQPDGSWAERTSKTSALGRTYSRSEWEAAGDPDPSTTELGLYDPFGRPGKITLPDGHVIQITYSGISRKTTKVPVGTSVAGDGSVVESEADTTEFYDRYGRLYDLREPGYATNAAARTGYEYDVLGNLKSVEMNKDGSPTQVRTFTYDGRGFLLSETHPELDTSITYSQYDAQGNPGRIVRGGWDLRYTYDAAGRPVLVHEQNVGRDWKEWVYATANGTNPVDYAKGKLRSMTRHNWVLYPGSTTTWLDPAVTQTYTYADPGGRISSVATDVDVGGYPHFDYSLTYDALGEVTHRNYPQCTHDFCAGATTARTVIQTFTRGLLTAVPGYASSITYHPNDLLASVQHTNGVSLLQDRDPDDMVRPARIRTVGASTDMDTGIFQYDGAGNIVAIGPEHYVYDLQSRIKDADLEVTSLLCSDYALHGGTDSTSKSYEACRNLTADGGYTVSGTGSVTLRAGSKIVLDGPVSVQAGGYLKAEVDPTLANGQEGTLTQAQSYSYDFFGNLLSATTTVEGQSPVTRTFATNSSTNRLTGASYDTSGNVTSWAGNSFDYDPFNLLRHGPGHVYVYGPGDERLWDIDWTGGTDPSNWIETWTLRDLDGTPLRRYRDVGGNTQTADWTLDRDYVWRGNSLLAAITPSSLEYFVSDHLGSPRQITDLSGNIVARHRYYPFGEEATDPSQDAEVIKFTGHERDFLGTGTTDDLDYLHARYYSPHLGRFFSVDPQNRYRAQGNPQLWDRYTYTAGNPLKYIDPNGKDLKIVYDFSKSNLTYREQLNLKIAVRRTFVNAGVRNVQSFSAGGAIQPAVRKSTDRIVYVKIKAEPMKSGGFGNTPPLSNKSTVSTARAPAEADKKLTFLTNVTAHEVGHGSRALDQYVFDGAGGPSGDHGTVMQEDEAVESYSSKMLDFSPQDAKALQQTLNDPCDKSSGNCEEPEKK